MQLRISATLLAMLLPNTVFAKSTTINDGGNGALYPPQCCAVCDSCKPSFEVASIKPNEHWKLSLLPYSLDSDESFVSGQSLFEVDASLTSLIAFAYKLKKSVHPAREPAPMGRFAKSPPLGSHLG